MTSLDRKAAIAAYKKREREIGIYVLRCRPSGEAWVGSSPHLDKIWNRIRFTLEHGSHPARTLQAAWQTHGVEAFAFEVLEEVEDEETAYLLNATLKERAAHWRARLGAEVV